MDIQDVKLSYQRCCERGEEFFDSFYANLVDRETAIGQLFADTDMQKQNELIEVGIGHLIAFAEGDEQAERSIREIGRTHSRHYINVRPEYYPLWVESLMKAAKEHDPQFNATLETQWRNTLAPGIALIVSLYE